MRFALLLLAAFATAQSSSTVAFHSAASLAERDAQIIRAASGAKPSFSVLGRTANTSSALIHRAATGEAELHDNFSDFFLVRSGHATLVTGGQLLNPRTVSPGEFAAPSITGGNSRPVAPGDLVYIPARLPHHLVLDKGQTITYLIIKARE